MVKPTLLRQAVVERDVSLAVIEHNVAFPTQCRFSTNKTLPSSVLLSAERVDFPSLPWLDSFVGSAHITIVSA